MKNCSSEMHQFELTDPVDQTLKKSSENSLLTKIFLRFKEKV